MLVDDSASMVNALDLFWHRHRPAVIKGLIVALVIGTLLSLPLRPLWVDEIYQLEATRDQSFSAMLHSAMVAPGGMPLAYTAQKLWLDIAGFSNTQARLPAATFGLASVWALAWAAKLLKINVAPVAVLGLVTPLLFRYSTEARPYSQGLFFSVLSTALFLRWWQSPSSGKLLVYSLCCFAGILSQPFSLFVAISHGVYVLLMDRKRFIPIFAALTLPALLYTPWFLLSRQALLHEAWPHLMFFSWHQISPLMIVREISGGGYVCSLALLIFTGVALKKGAHSLPLLWVTIPACLAIGADAIFNYFFAIRQLVFILPPLLLLAVSGFETLWNKQRTIAIGLTTIYLTGATVKDVRWQMDHKEDWAKAAFYISNQLKGERGCVIFIPNRDAPSYYFFEPSLRSRTCNGDTQRAPILNAVSPYADAADRRTAHSGQNIGNTLLVKVDR